ncbi:MAG TPA: hypothetical protein VLB72_14715, partial [Burkholderiales bacterium]|nr:hypothetical protein [Burkholderiales bacterium]
YIALGRDLRRTVEFFRRVDKIKPSRDQFMKKHRIASKETLDFIRGYEAAVAGTIEGVLAKATRR